MELAQEFVGERAAFLQDGMKVVLELHEGRPIGISLPDQVALPPLEADPVVKGQTAASSYKPAVPGERCAHHGAALCDGGRKGHRRHE